MNKCVVDDCSSTIIRARNLCAKHWNYDRYGQCKNGCSQPARSSKGLCNNCHKRNGAPPLRINNGYCNSCDTKMELSRCPNCLPNKKKNENLIRRYGISLDTWNNILTEQGNSCKICDRGSKRFTVDHDHNCCPGKITCGKCIRGIICENCNRALGLIEDSTKTLNGMIEYLNNDRN